MHTHTSRNLITLKKSGFKTTTFSLCLEELVDFKNNMMTHLPLVNFFFDINCIRKLKLVILNLSFFSGVKTFWLVQNNFN